ncbi:MAG: hypothetical protein ACYTKD_28210, partial [Planctomycetota bacterium]
MPRGAPGPSCSEDPGNAGDLKDAPRTSPVAAAPADSAALSSIGLLAMILHCTGCGTAPPRSPRTDGDASPGPAKPAGAIEIDYPLDGAVFPPELPPPTFRWSDSIGSKSWRVAVELGGGKGREGVACEVRETAWTPTEAEWGVIKQQSIGSEARLVVTGVGGPGSASPRRATTTFSTSRNLVGAPLFYREVNLPFVDAVKDPSHIRWRFGPVSSRDAPPVVLEGMLVCGNCHSFSDDGRTLGMDVDYANDKGSYAIVPV